MMLSLQDFYLKYIKVNGKPTTLSEFQMQFLSEFDKQLLNLVESNSEQQLSFYLLKRRVTGYDLVLNNFVDFYQNK